MTPQGARSWPNLLGRLIARTDLDAADTAWAMDEVMAGNASPAQVAAFVVALRAKGETADELSGLAATMLAHARRVDLDLDVIPAIDVVGTGGDGAHTVNISTMSAIVAAGAGVPVVKHGNRAASSQCGTADVLEALGVAIDLGPSEVARSVSEAGIGFCFAPVFHPAMRHAAGPRREIGVPTAFNLLGPLTNPAQPRAALVGCADERMAPAMAQVFASRGAYVLVVRGDDGLDEITTATTTSVWVASGGAVRRERIDVTALGVTPAPEGSLRGGDASHNADVVRDLVAGKPGAVRDAVVLNAAGALAAAAGPSGDVVADLRAAIPRAQDAIDSGAAAELLARWADVSSRIAAERPTV